MGSIFSNKGLRRGVTPGTVINGISLAPYITELIVTFYRREGQLAIGSEPSVV